MEQLTRSRTAMALAVGGAFLFLLGDVLGVVGYAILSPGHVGTFTGLSHGAEWLRFSGALVVLVAVCSAGWELVLKTLVGPAVEVGVAAAGTLLVAIGALVAAASPRSLTAPDVLTAVGIALWSFLVLSRAARQSIEEQQHLAPGRPAQAPVWLGAAMGLLILAVGSGLPTDIADRGSSVASGVLMAVGVGILAGALLVARSDRLLAGRPVPVMLAGLGIVTIGFLADAVVAGIVFGPSGTLTGLRVGVSLALAIQVVGVGALGVAAWLRVGELVLGSTRTSTPPADPGTVAAPPPMVPPFGDLTVSTPTPTPTPPPPTSLSTPEPAPTAPETAVAPCPACGAPTSAWARYCAQCGRALV